MLNSYSVVWGLEEGEALGLIKGGFDSETRAQILASKLQKQDPSLKYSVVPSEKAA